MEETYNTKAIILDRQPFREFDSRVVVYSLDKGKLELIARGAKKIKSKLACHLEPISLSNLMVARGKRLNYICGAVSENCYGIIKNDFQKIIFIGNAINIFNKLIKQEDRSDSKIIFNLLLEFLRIADREDALFNNYELLSNFFIFKLLVQLGYKPELYNCVVCNKKVVPDGNYFDFLRGGLICGHCYNVNNNLLKISEDCIKILRLSVRGNLSILIKLQISDQLAKKINSVINCFASYYKNA